MRRSTLAAAITFALLALGGVIAVGTVSAHVNQATIDPMAQRAIGGSYAVVTGTISCSAGESFQINMTMGQGTTGAQARGSTAGRCTGITQGWEVTALTRLDGSLLQPGLARVCWNAANFLFGQSTDVRQSCSTVTLYEPSLAVFP